MSARLDGFVVLILEDDFYIADDARATLEAAGATVLGPCPDAASAFSAIDGQAADCAVVDLNLGQGPSFEPARELLARRVSVVLVTGYDPDVIPAEFATVPRLRKPTEPRKLVQAVHHVCSCVRQSSDMG